MQCRILFWTVLGGGIVGGSMYTILGLEQSAKSTLASTIMANMMNTTIPVVSYMDAEGSTSSDYIESIMQNFSNDDSLTIEDLFGCKDTRTGRWIKPARVRYYAESILERVFDYIAKLQRSLPDKVKVGDEWFIIYENTKINQKIVGSNYDKEYYRTTGKFRVPIDNSDIQALVLIDSYPSLLPAKMDVEELGGAMAMQARAYSEQIKRIKGRMRSKRMTLIGINQLRLKPGVTYGCLRGNVPIPFVDGSSHKIQEIVENKLQGQVWSFNELTRKIEPKRITGWHYNGEVTDSNDWLQIKARVPESKNGFASVTVTPDHKIMTNEGWKKAKDIRIGDKVVTRYNSCPEDAIPFLAGVLCGDSSLMWDSRSINTALALTNSEQPEYNAWKLEKLSSFMDFKPTYTVSSSSNKRGSYDVTVSVPYYFLTKLHRKIKPRDPTKIADHFTLLSLAVLYMDDGHRRPDRHTASICFKRFKGSLSKIRQIQEVFRRFGYDTYTNANIADTGSVILDPINFDKFAHDICEYVHPSMQYKLPQKYRGRFKDFNLPSGGVSRVRPEYVEVISITQGSTGHIRNPLGKYDITVEDNHSYLAGNPNNGIIVSNSPEYEPSGEALKFASDVRLKLTSRAISGVPQARGKGQVEEEPSVIIDGATDQYRYVHAKAIKNKLSTPNLEAWLRIWVTDGQRARGFDLVWDTYQYGLMTGQLYGKRDKISLKLISNQGQILESKKPLNWMDFKTWVLGTPEQVAEVCAKIGVKTFYLRKFFAKQSATELGIKLYFDNKLATKDSAKNTDTDTDDDTRYDDDVDGSNTDDEDYDDGLNGSNKPKTRNI